MPKAEDVVSVDGIDNMGLSALKALATDLGIIRSDKEPDERVLRAQLRSCAL